jgi:hypothetical protein
VLPPGVLSPRAVTTSPSIRNDCALTPMSVVSFFRSYFGFVKPILEPIFSFEARQRVDLRAIPLPDLETGTTRWLVPDELPRGDDVLISSRKR